MSAIAKNGILYQGGTPVIDITNVALQELISTDSYNPYVLYNITDLNDNTNIIDDNSVNVNTTWSSAKISSMGGGVDYSTDEQDTGLTWVDGKKVYQKSYDITLTSGETELETAEFMADKKIIGGEGGAYSTQGYACALGGLASNGDWAFNFHIPPAGNLLAYVTSALIGGHAYMTIRYIKET